MKHKPEDMNEHKEFIEWVKQERANFVTQYWEFYPTAKQRVIAENLLVAYDQMVESLEKILKGV